jgi:hypothetical protein
MARGRPRKYKRKREAKAAKRASTNRFYRYLTNSHFEAGIKEKRRKQLRLRVHWDFFSRLSYKTLKRKSTRGILTKLITIPPDSLDQRLPIDQLNGKPTVLSLLQKKKKNGHCCVTKVKNCLLQYITHLETKGS